MRPFPLIAAVSAALTIGGCGGAIDEPEAPKGPEAFVNSPAPTEAQKTSVEATAKAVNAFALKLAQKADSEKGNVLVSPFSVASAHAMLLAGATDETQKELQNALALGAMKPEQIHNGMFALAYEATKTEARELSIANGVFPLQSFPFEKPFEDTLRKSYDAEFRTLNGPTQASIDQINEWVKGKTAGMIPKVLKSLTPNDILVLVNATTFIGRWEKEFDPGDTKEADFTLSSGEKVKAPTMSASEVQLRYGKSDECAAISLPYKGGAYNLVILLPNPGVSPHQLLQGLDEARWSKIVSGMEPNEAVIELPKFTLDAAYDLRPIMESLGAKRMFQRDQAQLPAITKAIEGRLWVSQDVHCTHIEVDEKGTKAAAATAIDVAAEAMATEPLVVKVNRSFLYAIVERKSKAIVFLGVCEDPTKTKAGE